MNKLPQWIMLLLLAVLAGCEVTVEELPQAGADPAAARTEAPTAASTTEQSGDVMQPAPASATHSAAQQARVARGKLRFIEGYQQGYKYALEAGKPMLVFFTAEWCHYCHQMADEAFTHEQVMGLSERFVCILVDADAEPEVCKQFRVQGYPTIQFLSPRGVPLNRIVGKKPGHQVMMAMQAALQNVARRDQSGNRS